MIFDFKDWPGGRMITPTLAGTRPGGAIAAAWAVMNFLGIEGYCARQDLVTRTRERIEAGVKALGFSVFGRPQLGIVSFGHSDANCLSVWAKLRERGWFTSLNTAPQSLHLMLSPFHAGIADAYLADLACSQRRQRFHAHERDTLFLSGGTTRCERRAKIADPAANDARRMAAKIIVTHLFLT